MEEIWKDIKGYEGLYQVSNLGRVRSFDRLVKRKDGRTFVHYGKILSPSSNGNGYQHLILTKDGKHKDVLVHRLVAEAFLPNPDNLPQVNHKDERPDNNCLDNLEWCAISYNCNYGRHKSNLSKSVTNTSGKKIYKCTTEGEPIMGYKSVKDAAYDCGLKPTNICNVLKGHNKTAGGFKWRYAS